MVQELAKASEELPAADISVDVSANNGRDDAELSDIGEDPGDSAPLYTNKEEVYSTDVPSARVVWGIEDATVVFALYIGLILAQFYLFCKV